MMLCGKCGQETVKLWKDVQGRFVSYDDRCYSCHEEFQEIKRRCWNKSFCINHKELGCCDEKCWWCNPKINY